MRLTFTCLLFIFMLSLPERASAWNATGHQLVARIAWNAMTPAVRQRVIALLEAAPSDACLRELLPADARPLAARRREFFMDASTWADIVRPGENDTRPCTRFNRPEWHYINYFWQGVSGATGPGRPTDRSDLVTPTSNVVAQLPLLRAFAACTTPQCGTTTAERALALAWILHLVGDMHQPLHTNARITSQPNEQKGDQGGNLFVLQTGPPALRLHGYWDSIVDRSVPRQDGESQPAYVGRVAASLTRKHPRTEALARLRPGDFDAWAREGLDTAKMSVYPATLKRGELPGEEYRVQAFRIAEAAIALAGYRLGDLLNRMFGA
jgi:hypothetical protein